MQRRSRISILGLCLLLHGAQAQAKAQEAETDGEVAQETEEKSLGWTKTAELSLVSTSGNSSANTFGFNATFDRTMETGTFELSARGLLAEAALVTRRAVGSSPEDFTIEEATSNLRSAEEYFARVRYDRQIGDRLFWYGGLSWEKNEFSGVNKRIIGGAGIGNLWWERQKNRFRTGYGLSYTTQDELVKRPGLPEEYLGATLSYDYRRKILTSGVFRSQLALSLNFEESTDRRADFANSMVINMSQKLALKVSVQWLYDNLPALGVLPLISPEGAPTGDFVVYELEKLDTTVTTALVVNF